MNSEFTNCNVYPTLDIPVDNTIIDFPIELKAPGYNINKTTYQNMSNCEHRFGIGRILYQIHEDQSISIHSNYISDWEIRNTIMHHYRDEYENVTFNGIKVLQCCRDKISQQQKQQQQITDNNKEQIQQDIKTE